MRRDGAYLIVRSAGRRVGLPIAQILEVVEPGQVFAVPSVEPAVRGVLRIRGRIMPVFHLGTLLAGGACPPEIGGTGVILAVNDQRVCLEVDDAESVLRDPGVPVPSGASLPWAVAVARHEGDLVPLLDLSALAGRSSEAHSA